MMFTPGGMVIKMYVQLKYSFAEDRKILLADQAKHLSAPERSF